MLHLLQKDQVKDMNQLRLCHISLGCYLSAQGQALCRLRSGQLPGAVTVKGTLYNSLKTKCLFPTDQPHEKQLTMDFWSEALVTNAVLFIALGSTFMGNEPETHI